MPVLTLELITAAARAVLAMGLPESEIIPLALMLVEVDA